MIKNKTYTNIIEMDRDKDAVAEFGLISYIKVDKVKIGYMYGH